MADDPFRIADQVDANMLEIMVSRLEERGRDARFLGMIDDYLDVAGISEANEVLDIGCGTGVVARRIAGRKDFFGRVTGIDLSSSPKPVNWPLSKVSRTKRLSTLVIYATLLLTKASSM